MGWGRVAAPTRKRTPPTRPSPRASPPTPNPSPPCPQYRPSDNGTDPFGGVGLLAAARTNVRARRLGRARGCAAGVSAAVRGGLGGRLGEGFARGARARRGLALVQALGRTAHRLRAEAMAKAGGAKLLAVARLAKDLAVVLRERRRVQALLARRAREAPLMPVRVWTNGSESDQRREGSQERVDHSNARGAQDRDNSNTRALRNVRWAWTTANTRALRNVRRASAVLRWS